MEYHNSVHVNQILSLSTMALGQGSDWKKDKERGRLSNRHYAGLDDLLNWQSVIQDLQTKYDDLIRGIKDGVYDDHEDEPCAENQKSEEKAIATLAEAQHERYELENPKVEELATQTLTGISEKQPGVETTDRLSDTQEQPAAESPTSKELQSMRDRVEELENELKSSKTREETTSKEIKDAAKMCIEECVTELVALQVQLAKKEKEKQQAVNCFAKVETAIMKFIDAIATGKYEPWYRCGRLEQFAEKLVEVVEETGAELKQNNADAEEITTDWTSLKAILETWKIDLYYIQRRLRRRKDRLLERRWFPDNYPSSLD